MHQNEKRKHKKPEKPTPGMIKKQVAPKKKEEPKVTGKRGPGKGMEDFKSKFLKSLENKKEDLKQTLESLINSRKEYDGQLNAGDFIDEVDDAQREISAYSQFSLIERKNKELQQVEYLIDRILKEEEFGLCEECGNPIPKERLLIVPETTLCVTCQRELEKIDSRKAMVSKISAGFGSRQETEWEGAEGPEEEDNMFIEYHIDTLPVVDEEEAGPDTPQEEKDEK